MREESACGKHQLLSARAIVSCLAVVMVVSLYVNCAVQDGWTPLIYAASTGLLDVVTTILLADKASLDCRTIKVRELRSRHVPAPNCLCDVAVFVVVQGGWTAIGRAAYRGHASVVTFLREAGADTQITNTVRYQVWLGRAQACILRAWSTDFGPA